MTYTWSAFTEADLLANGLNGTDFGCGDKFVMPGAATVTMATTDDDRALNGDNGWFADDKSEDWFGQDAYVNGCRVGGKMYAEQYHVLIGSDGKTYHLAEIKIEGHDSAGAGNGYFTFYGAVPPAGVTLTVTQTCNVSGSWLTYDCLSATPPKPAPGCITGRLTLDANLDNTESNGAGGYDAGIAGKTVQLLNAAGAVVATTTTDAQGNYSFSAAPGQYVVKFPTLDGFKFAQQGVGAATENSDANASGLTATITLASGQTVANIDAGVQKVNAAPVFTSVPTADFCVIENKTFAFDLNATDADCDTLTYKIAGGADATKFTIDAKTGVLSFVTAPDFEKPGSAAGTNQYAVIVTVEDGRGGSDTKALTIGVCDDAADNGGTHPTCTIVQAECMKLCNFYVGGGGNYIYQVTQGTSTAQTTFGGVAGSYDLTIRSYDGQGEAYVSLFVNGVKVGTYGENNDDYQWEDHTFAGVQLKPGDVVTIQGSDCGIVYVDYLKICPTPVKVGALEGRLFVDANENGVDDAEAGVGGVTVQLLDSTGRVVGTTVTAADGGYQFANLAAGAYTVVFPTSVNGRVLTAQNAGGNDAIDSDANVTTGVTDAVTVVAGQTTKDVDAGIKDPGTASLEGRAFVDANKDGVDNAEAGVAGQTVRLVNAAGVVIATAVTAADGSYKFTGLDAGTYSVTFPTSAGGRVPTAQNAGADDTVDSDAGVTTGATGTYAVAIGQNVKDVDAGYKDPGTASLEGRAFVDANKDSIDNAEAGVAGQTVQLVNAAGQVVATTTTAADGSYKFANLDAGTYSVTFPTTAGGRVLTAQNAGANDAVDSDAAQATGRTGTYVVNVGDAVKDVDAGYKDPGTAALAGRAFVDANRDGIDNAEAGVAGQTVQLLDAAGNVLRTATTGADGSYEFTGLDAGTYSVRFPTAAGGRVLTAQNAGANDAVDSDANVTTGQTGTYAVALGQRVTDVDAGYKDPGTAALGDRVFLDADRDGFQDAGEAGVAGVTVTLFDAAGATVASTVTNATGNYLFSGLAAGTYAVGFGTLTGLTYTVANAADDAFDSDANATTGRTAPVTLALGETNLTVDAGLVQLNRAPDAVNDTGRTCADTPLRLDVLANDTDPDGNPLRIVQVGGTNIAEGQTVTAADGVRITLSGGQLTFDATGTAYEDALVGTSNQGLYRYTISDGQGGFDTATATITFCGTTNTLDTIAMGLPKDLTFRVNTLAETPLIDAYTVTIAGTGDARLDGRAFAEAYCLVRDDALVRGVNLDANGYAGSAAQAAPSSLGPVVLDRLDEITWLVNQDFTLRDNGDGAGRTYTDAEVQGAIWQLTGNNAFVPAGAGTLANALELANLALTQGGGYVPGEGDEFLFVIDPDVPNPYGHEQPFVVSLEFDDFAMPCMC